MDSVTIHWKAVEQNFTVMLFVFQFYPVCNFATFIIFGLGTDRSEGVKILLLTSRSTVNMLELSLATYISKYTEKLRIHNFQPPLLKSIVPNH